MIVNSIWWDDSQYLVEAIGGDFATTRVTEDGQGLFTSMNEASAVTAGLDDEGPADAQQVA